MTGRVILLRFLSGWIAVLSAGLLWAAESDSDKVDFNRDVRPILSKACFACHGSDEGTREAGLRLDAATSARKELDSGEVALVPGHPEKSELFRRITSDDEAEVMPPADSGHELTAGQIKLLKRWIEQGAVYAKHWSYVKPRQAPLPGVKNTGWSRNGIDRFVLARLERGGLSPSPAANRYMLIRRLSFDLRGLPPTLKEVDVFINDKTPHAYEKLIDRFLADSAYGERWARMWLDLARYADSRGYGSDPLRPNIWRYRDWVIDAFNRNLPYDRFSVEQLAGDLLPNPTLDQRIATAFHRNTMTNTEGGTDDEEFRVAAVKDRVDTTIQVWMGLTMGCAKCHSHKYDPIAQREYYQFYAFFNQSADNDRPDEAPTISAPTPEILKQVEQLEAKIGALKQRLDIHTPELAAAQAKWESTLSKQTDKPVTGRYVRIELPGASKLLSLAEVQVFSKGMNVAVGGKATQSSLDHDGKPELAIDGKTDGRYFDAKSTTHTKTESNPWWEVDLGKTVSIGKIAVWNRTDNKLQSRLKGLRIIVLADAESKTDQKPSRKTVWQRDDSRFPNPKTEYSPGGPRSTVSSAILAIIDTLVEKRTETQKNQLASHYRSTAPLLNPLRAEIARFEKSRPKIPTVPVMQDLPADKRRETYIMVKGSFLTKGDKVGTGVLQAFHAIPRDAPQNRLGMANWLMDENNPLTARVAVNRFWAQLFGIGIVETEEDFGTQGELPTHPQLLDWMAVEFMKNNWDIKQFLKLVVTSATYRQSSRVTPVVLKQDPRNRLFACGPRFRLEAEMVRDQALSLSGLLSRKISGPSVYPPQPPGLWRAAFNGQRKWPTSKGEDRYRRGLYTFLRRTIPYPSMATFDAPSRELCSIRRIRTNTPLQAFVTMNDPVFVEASQALARRIMKEGGDSPEARIRYALRLCLIRPPHPKQVEYLLDLYRSELRHYQTETEAAQQIATDPLGPLPREINPAEAAAWTVISNVLLNLDSVLARG